jgi:citrate lyase subunit beta/citryl-CoA lyase
MPSGSVIRGKIRLDPAHAAVINRVFTSSLEGVHQAERIVAAFEAAKAAGDGRADLNGLQIDVSIYRNAQHLSEQART